MNTEPANAIRNYMARIAYLRQEQTNLVVGSNKLTAYGITGHLAAVTDRLAAIGTEVTAIAVHLLTLGAHSEAQDAISGWAVVLKTRRPEQPHRSHGNEQRQ